MSKKTYWNNHWASDKKSPPNPFAEEAYTVIRKGTYKTLLDLGCGDGRDSLFFAEKGLEVTALDFSQSGIQNIKSLNPDIKTQLVDIKDIKFGDNSFDVIYAHLSLHYFDDSETDKIFQNLYRILTNDGLIFVKCKSTDDALYGKGERVGLDMYREGHLRHFFSEEYMASKMRDFKLLSLHKTSSVYHTYVSAFVEAVATK